MMLDIWDWELLGNPSRDRLEEWGYKRQKKYWQLYGIKLNNYDLELRHAQLLQNPIFLAIAHLQEFWQYWTWVIRYRLIRTWYQDLNEDKRHWIHGRGRVYLTLNDQRKIDTYQCVKLYASWCAPTSSLCLEVAVGGEDNGLVIHFGCLLFKVWIGLEGIWSHQFNERIGKYDHKRYTGASFHDSTIWVAIWRDEMGYQNWGGIHWSFNIPDFLFGQHSYREVPIEETTEVIFLPEGEYKLTAKLYWDIWKRSRLPWAQRLKRCEISPARPIPIPGKGENDWDQDEDAIHGSTLQADSIAEAITRFTANIKKIRRRHGGEEWMPEVVVIDGHGNQSGGETPTHFTSL